MLMVAPIVRPLSACADRSSLLSVVAWRGATKGSSDVPTIASADNPKTVATVRAMK
jgi:hypothetical protein